MQKKQNITEMIARLLVFFMIENYLESERIHFGF